MGVFMDGGFGCGYRPVNIYLIVTDKPIDLTIAGLEEHGLSLTDILPHAGSDGDRVHLALDVQLSQLYIFGMHAPLPAVLLHEVHEHHVIEALHAVSAYTQVPAIETLPLLCRKNLVGKRLADNFGERLSDKVILILPVAAAPYDAVPRHEQVDGCLLLSMESHAYPAYF